MSDYIDESPEQETARLAQVAADLVAKQAAEEAELDKEVDLRLREETKSKIKAEKAHREALLDAPRLLRESNERHVAEQERRRLESTPCLKPDCKCCSIWSSGKYSQSTRLPTVQIQERLSVSEILGQGKVMTEFDDHIEISPEYEQQLRDIAANAVAKMQQDAQDRIDKSNKQPKGKKTK